MTATASWGRRARSLLFTAAALGALAGCAAPAPPSPPRVAAPQDACQVDCDSWLRYSIPAAISAQRAHLCGCLGAGPAGRAVTLQLLISAEGIAGTRVVARNTSPAVTRCLLRRAGAAAGRWLALKPGWYRAGGSWSPARLAASWRKTPAPLEYDWEGITCSPAEAATDPGEPRLPASWIRAHRDGLACEVFQCAPSPRCCKPRNVVWQLRLAQGRAAR